MTEVIRRKKRVKVASAELSIETVSKQARLLPFDSPARRQRHMRAQPNPIVPNMADAVQWYFYDRLIIAAATATAVNYKMFTVPIGGTKTKNDTNLEQASRLSDPQWMNVTSMGFLFSDGIAKADMDSFLNGYYCELWVGNKVYSEGPLMFFPSGMGVSGSISQTLTTTNTSNLANGTPVLSNSVDLRLPAGIQLGDEVSDGITGITILQGQTFRMELWGTSFTTAAAAGTTFGTGVNMLAVLSGILSRGVQ